jgi:hypothetical protein
VSPPKLKVEKEHGGSIIEGMCFLVFKESRHEEESANEILPYLQSEMF